MTTTTTLIAFRDLIIAAESARDFEKHFGAELDAARKAYHDATQPTEDEAKALLEEADIDPDAHTIDDADELLYVDICAADRKPVSECKGAACKAHGRCCWQ